MRTLLVALGSVALSVAAQFALKAGVGSASAATPRGAGMLDSLSPYIFNPWLVGGFALYGASAVLWLGVLAQWDVSKAYPLTGLGFLGAVLVGYLLGEQVNATRIAGALLITSGVVLLSRS